MQQTGKAELTAKPNISNTGYFIAFLPPGMLYVSCTLINAFSGGSTHDVQLQPLVETADRQANDKIRYAKGGEYQLDILAKMGKDEPVAMDTLAKIATALECGLDDIVEIQNDAKKGGELDGKEES